MNKLQNDKYVIEYISNNDELNDCLQHLSSSARFAFDLEFDNNRYAYGVHLCLIQASTATRCFIIDPLKGIDVQGFFRLLEKPEILKILHCHGEDLRLLHSSGCRPVNLFDTEIAAKLLNYERTSLAVMLEAILGVTLNKSEQSTNWLKRPLSPAQVIYASNDVIYLAQLMEALMKEAEAKGRPQWIKEENRVLDTVVFSQTAKDSLLSAKDKKELSPYHQFILNEWLKFREEIAEKNNKPAYQVISPEVLRDIIEGKAALTNWVNMPGIYRELKTEQFKQVVLQKHAGFVEQAGAQALSKQAGAKIYLPPAEWNIKRAQTAQLDKAITTLFTPLKEYLAQQYGKFTASFILSNSLVNDLVQGKKKISDLRAPYRTKLLEEASTHLGMNIQAYK